MTLKKTKLNCSFINKFKYHTNYHIEFINDTGIYSLTD